MAPREISKSVHLGWLFHLCASDIPSLGKNLPHQNKERCDDSCCLSAKRALEPEEASACTSRTRTGRKHGRSSCCNTDEGTGKKDTSLADKEEPSVQFIFQGTILGICLSFR